MYEYEIVMTNGDRFYQYADTYSRNKTGEGDVYAFWQGQKIVRSFPADEVESILRKS